MALLGVRDDANAPGGYQQGGRRRRNRPCGLAEAAVAAHGEQEIQAGFSATPDERHLVKLNLNWAKLPHVGNSVPICHSSTDGRFLKPRYADVLTI